MYAINKSNKPKRAVRANSPKQALISKLSWALCWATNKRRVIDLNRFSTLAAEISEHYPQCANVHFTITEIVKLDNKILELKKEQEQYMCFLFTEINKHEKAKPRSKKDGRKAETS